MNAFYATFADTSAVDEASLREALEYVGVPLRLEQWNTEASADAIRHYAMGIGDPNPLWQDESYARDSAQGVIVAPPTFLYSVYVGFAPGLPGLPAYLRRVDWRFLDWVRRGDQLRTSVSLRDAALVENKHGAKRIHQYPRTEYSRTTAAGTSTLIASSDDTVVRPPGPGHPGALAYEPRPEHGYSEAELADIERAVLAVRRRGPQPRYWEDVEAGDQVDRIVKGPYTRMTMLCYHMGAAGAPNYRAFDIWWRNRHAGAHRSRRAAGHHHQPGRLRRDGCHSARPSRQRHRADPRDAWRLRQRPPANRAARELPHELDGRPRLPVPADP